MPNTYARGILFGKMLLELGDLSVIRNDTTGYNCDVDFKTKVGGEVPTALTRRDGCREATTRSQAK